MGLLTELIQRDAWNELAESLSISIPDTHPREVTLVAELNVSDRLGRTPLHYACAKKRAPAEVVSLMLDKVTNWSSWNCHDICGNTLLHAAATCGNANVLRVLLDKLPLPAANNMACSAWRLHCLNDMNMTPLMMAWKKYLNPSFTLFGDMNSAGHMSPMLSENIHILTSVHHVADLEREQFERLLDLWNKTLVLVDSARRPAHDNPSGNTNLWRPLHDFVTLGTQRSIQCPTVAYWLAIRLHGDQLGIPDEHGNLPLHLAAQLPECPVIPMNMQNDDGGDDHDDGNLYTRYASHYNKNSNHTSELSMAIATESILTQLTKRYPAAANIVNDQQRLPIHLAIESGKRWDHGVYALVCASPHTLERRDVKTKLPPFLLAATSPRSSVSLLLDLIRARPDLLQTALQTTDTPNLADCYHKSQTTPTAMLVDSPIDIHGVNVDSPSKKPKWTQGELILIQ